jgi:branched-chain amino acid transport system permease protein
MRKGKRTMIQDLLNALTLGSIYLLFALGMALVWGTIGILNFAHGSIFMFATFISYLIAERIVLPLPVILVIAAAVGAILSVAVQVLAFQPIMRRAQILIGGIGIAAVPIAIAQRATLSNPFGLGNSSFQVQIYEIGDVRVSNIMIMILFAGLVLGGGLAWWIKVSRQGLALRAIGVNDEVASIMGINKQRLALATMALGGALAGLAGALLTVYLSAITPESGDALLIKAFAAIVLGGLGSIAGVIAGSLVLALSETLVLTHTSGTWVNAVSFGLIFLILVVRPQGIFGRKNVVRT